MIKSEKILKSQPELRPDDSRGPGESLLPVRCGFPPPGGWFPIFDGKNPVPPPLVPSSSHGSVLAALDDRNGFSVSRRNRGRGCDKKFRSLGIRYRGDGDCGNFGLRPPIGAPPLSFFFKNKR